MDAFWSITLYNAQGFQVANGLNRFAVSSWMPFKHDPDGSLTLYFQNESPGQGQGGQLAAGPERAIQSDHAPLRSEIRCAYRQMGPAADHADAATSRFGRSINSEAK